MISYEVYQNVAGNNGFKFILAVVDVFSRFLMLENMRQKSETPAAFERILTRTGKTCRVFGSDGGGEFSSNAFQDMLQEKGIERRTRGDPNSINALAVVDSKIKAVREAFTRILGSADVRSAIWIPHTQRVANSINNNTTEAIGWPPSSFRNAGNEVWDAKVAEKNAAALEDSIKTHEKQKRGLSAGSSFRAPEERGQRGINRRAGRANFGDRAFTVKEIQGRTVVANEGDREFPVAQVLPVPAGSTQVSLLGIRRALDLRTQQIREQRGLA